MVQALIELDDNTNRVLNIVKAKYDLKDKGEAIKFVVTEFIEYEGEEELRPDYLEKLKKIQKEKGISFKTIEELRKNIDNA